ncbi:MAG: hypothetical protein AB8B69_19290 [Chitinophagales bacterium]
MNLSKTPLSIRKERELAYLKKRLKKTRTQLKSSTTRLANLQKGISALQQNIANKMMEGQEKMAALKEELLTLLDKIIKSKKVDEESKEQAKQFLEELQGLDAETPNVEDFEEDEDAKGRGGRFTFFEQFRTEPPKTEQRNIRKVFISLAARFHPDKASTPKETEHFHKLMQQINEAYERSDILTLLDIKAKYSDYKKEDPNQEIDESAIVSLLDQEIAKAENELSLLEGQLSRIKQESKELRKSEVGEIHREAKRVKKYGIDFVEQMSEEMQMGVNQLTAVRDLMKELLKTGTITNEMMMKAGLMPSLSMLFDDEEDGDYDDEDGDFLDNMSADDLQKAIMDMFGL